MQREKKNTPGYWKAYSGATERLIEIASEEGDTICHLIDGVGEPLTAGVSESNANAYLLAAAQELRDALEFVLDKCTLYGRADAAREKAEKALSKSYGEEV